MKCLSTVPKKDTIRERCASMRNQKLLPSFCLFFSAALEESLGLSGNLSTWNPNIVSASAYYLYLQNSLVPQYTKGPLGLPYSLSRATTSADAPLLYDFPPWPGLFCMLPFIASVTNLKSSQIVLLV